MFNPIPQSEAGGALKRKVRSDSLLDAGGIPVAELARLAEREGRRPSAIYQAHKWFARRFSSAFRALLVAARLPAEGDFWQAYYRGVDYRGLTVLDPFVGGGTSVVEASLLGANTVGIDVDAVACAITSFEIRAAATPDLESDLRRLEASAGRHLSRYYKTKDAKGEMQDVLHFFWVQEVTCRECGHTVEAHPHHQLAFEAEGDKQWAFCRHCHEVHTLQKDEKGFYCRECHERTLIHEGTVKYGKLECMDCGTTEQLIEVSERTRRPPKWRLFALETIPEGPMKRRVPMSGRTFQRATDEDRKLYQSASRALNRYRPRDGERNWIPARAIPRESRSDNRLIQYGYSHYRELFNDRQLLHLLTLAKDIDAVQGPAREALALAFSDHLTTNCMLTHYAFGWRRLAPLFSIRAFRHVSRPVEINPWLEGTGRGTFPNAVRQVQRSIESAKFPQVASLDGGFLAFKRSESEQSGRILQGDSRQPFDVPENSVDLILTDPPYFDNIAYSELSDFYLPWLQSFGLAAQKSEREEVQHNLAARSRGEKGYQLFREGLGLCFSHMRRVLKPDGRLVFSYQHSTGTAWEALAHALACGGFVPIQVFPLLGNSSSGLHNHEGTILWDAVTVCKRHPRMQASTDLFLSDAQVAAASLNARSWADRLAHCKPVAFRPADHVNLLLASLVAASLGTYGSHGRSARRPLLEVLESHRVASQATA
jgi:adenine-specific DNA methylase